MCSPHPVCMIYTLTHNSLFHVFIEITAGLPCHPDTQVYKKKFKDKREELAKKLFSLYNKEVFDNQVIFFY